MYIASLKVTLFVTLLHILTGCTKKCTQLWPEWFNAYLVLSTRAHHFGPFECTMVIALGDEALFWNKKGQKWRVIRNGTDFWQEWSIGIFAIFNFKKYGIWASMKPFYLHTKSPVMNNSCRNCSEVHIHTPARPAMNPAWDLLDTWTFNYGNHFYYAWIGILKLSISIN